MWGGYEERVEGWWWSSGGGVCSTFENSLSKFLPPKNFLDILNARQIFQYNTGDNGKIPGFTNLTLPTMPSVPLF
jgi:hypothetical protein